jgi:Lectin C-type domain
LLYIGDLKIETLWIGATDLGREGDFYWDGIGDVMGPYTNWNLSQPDNGAASGNEHCVYMLGTTQYWSDFSCSYLYRYLCEGKIEENATFNIYKVRDNFFALFHLCFYHYLRKEKRMYIRSTVIKHSLLYHLSDISFLSP